MPTLQYESIVGNLESPILVLAGPGAGKTYLLAHRVRRLLDQGVSENRITVVTFGRDASQHMRNKLLDPRDGFGIPYEKLPRISTLHSLALEIVNQKPRSVHLLKTGLKVQEDENAKQLLYRDASLILGFSEADGENARQCKAHGECAVKVADKQCAICSKYWEIMAKCNYLDFDDQLLFACRILQDNPEILREYQDKAEHLLVDEYQDINAAQFKLIEMLTRNSRSGLFAVGDDAQSIYSFRGADPAFILRFEEHFPGALMPPLAHSHRCHENTMRDAVRVLEAYYPGWTGPYELEYHVPAGEAPEIWQVVSEQAEAEFVARIARKAVPERKNVLILVPKKEFFPLISGTLRRYGVPHICPVNLLPEAVNRRVEVIRAILEWLRTPEDSFLTRLALEKLIDHGIAKVPGAGKHKRSKPETIRRRVEVEAEIAGLWERLDKRSHLWAVIASLESPSPAIHMLQEGLARLREAFEDAKEDLSGEFAKHLAVATGVWVDPSKLVKDLCSIFNLIASPQPTGFGSVQLMTMRKAKGLEAEIVVIVGLEDDIIPNPRSDETEEARLFYVSMTRARERLYLLHSYKRPRGISLGDDLTGKRRSRFLDAIGRPSKVIKRKVRTS